MEETNEEITEDTHIIKNALIGFVIVERKTMRKGERCVFGMPIGHAPCVDAFIGDEHLTDDEKVIGVIPAPSHSYVVSGHIQDDSVEDIGYEFEGAHKTDWIELLKYFRENRDKR